MSSSVKIAVVQAALASSRDANIEVLSDLANAAADAGANIVLLPELFEGPYFPVSQDEACFELARAADGHPTIEHFAKLAAKREVVMPVSFFERSGQSYFNSVAMLDASGELLGVYRKSHIPDGPGYQEKFYFRPGDTGFRTWETHYGRIGVAICWDQWFPEAARAMVLDGADILLYPTAIGSEPEHPLQDTRDRWQRAMIGHAVSNACIVAAANRVGDENGQTFYGSSFIADHAGEKIAELSRTEQTFAIAEVDLEALVRERAAWGFFRDRRPELYRSLTDKGND